MKKMSIRLPFAFVLVICAVIISLGLSSCGRNSAEVESIVLSEDNITISVGETFELSVVISPSNAADKSIKWSSSDKTVAVVNNGKVVGVKQGNASITAMAHNGKKAKCNVKVEDISVISIAFNKTSVSLSAGKTAKIDTTVYPKNATQKIVWESSSNNVASVDTRGNITAVGDGTCTITCRTEDNTVKANCVVTVGDDSVVSYTVTAATTQSTQSNDENIDVESRVKDIKEWYYDYTPKRNRKDASNGVQYETQDDQLVRVIIPKGYDNWDSFREYLYHDGKFCFAYIKSGTDEQRLYIYNDKVIRYKHNNSITDYYDGAEDECKTLKTKTTNEAQSWYYSLTQY